MSTNDTRPVTVEATAHEMMQMIYRRTRIADNAVCSQQGQAGAAKSLHEAADMCRKLAELLIRSVGAPPYAVAKALADPPPPTDDMAERLMAARAAGRFRARMDAAAADVVAGGPLASAIDATTNAQVFAWAKASDAEVAAFDAAHAAEAARLAP